MDVDHLEKLADAATPGPWAWWAVTETTASGFGPYGRVVGPTYVSIDHAEALSPADAEFIGSVHPETVKELCAELRRLRRQVAEKETVGNWDEPIIFGPA